MDYETIEVTPLGPFLGAEISGIDLRAPLSNRAAEELRAALFEHLAIFFRDQDITPDQHRNLSHLFGSAFTHPFFTRARALSEDYPEISLIEAGGHDTPVEPGTGFASWHTDVSFFEEPPLAAILRAKKLPPAGSDTMWASMYAAFDALSPAMKSFVSGLTAIHDIGWAYKEYFPTLENGYELLRQAEADHPDMEHPLVRTHPVTGRQILFVNEYFTKRIKELSESESKALLQMLYAQQRVPEFQIRFAWQEHSIAIWDEMATQHYALADYATEQRLMHRIMIAGERPFYRAAAA